MWRLSWVRTYYYITCTCMPGMPHLSARPSVARAGARSQSTDSMSIVLVNFSLSLPKRCPRPFSAASILSH